MTDVNNASASLQDALQDMNLTKESHKPFDEAEFLARPDFVVDVPIIDIHNKVSAIRKISVPRQAAIDERNRLFVEWLEEGRKDLKGILNVAICNVFRAATIEYLSSKEVRKKERSQPQVQAASMFVQTKPQSKPRYKVNPL